MKRAVKKTTPRSGEPSTISPVDAAPLTAATPTHTAEPAVDKDAAQAPIAAPRSRWSSMFGGRLTMSGPKQIALGINLSDGGIKIVAVGRSKKEVTIEGWAQTDLPETAYAHGTIRDQSAVTLALQKTLEGIDRRILRQPRTHIASISDEQTFFSIVHVAGTMIDRTTILAEAKKDIPLDFATSSVDWHALPYEENEGATPIFFIAARRAVVDAVTQTLSAARLPLDVIESEAVALARLFPHPSRHAILDLGKKRASLTIAEGDVPHFSLSLPLAGATLTTTIADALHIDAANAEEEKIRCGFDTNACGEKIRPVIRAQIDATIEKITIALEEAVAEDARHRPIESLVVTGGGAHLKGLSDILTERLGIPVTLGNLWEHITEPEHFSTSPLAWTIPLSLALRGLSH